MRVPRTFGHFSTILLLGLLLLSPISARAAFPGSNGKIAVSSDRDGDFEIYAINQDGSGDTNLTNNPATDFQAAWSPDGTRIAFQSNRDGNFEIYVMGEDGSGQTRLTNDSGNDASPAWSPDGSKVAFSSTRDGNAEIYVMNADGSSPSRLTNNSTLDIIPRWSPDDSKIAFTSTRDGNFEAYSMGTDGSAQTNLSQNPADDFASSWYPNGSKLAFSSDRDGNSNVYMMNSEGTSQTRISDDPASDTDPAFSPDGSEITFDSDRGGSLGLWRIELSLPFTRGGPGSDPATPVEDSPGDDSGGGESQQPIVDPPHVLVAKHPNVKEAAPGDEIEWTIIVQNAGGFAENVIVRDSLLNSSLPLEVPSGASTFCSGWTKVMGVGDMRSVCELGDLAGGEVRVIHVRTMIRRSKTYLSAINIVDVLVNGQQASRDIGSVRITCGRSGRSTPVAENRLRGRSLRAAAASIIRGTREADLLCGTGKADVLDGRGGNDKIFGLGGDDVLIGGGGKDKLVGGPGDDMCSQTDRAALKPCK